MESFPLPQPDPNNQQPNNIFLNENGILSFKKRSKFVNQQRDKTFKNENGILAFNETSDLVPNTLLRNKLLAEKYPDSEKGYLVVRDTKSKNYFAVSDKLTGNLGFGNKKDGSIVYKAIRYTKIKESGMIGHHVALKRYSEATCLDKKFPISNEEKALKKLGLDEGELIKITSGKKGCFMPMKLVRGNTLKNLIKSGKLTVGKFGKSEINPSNSIVEIFKSIEIELSKLHDLGMLYNDIHSGNVMIDDSNQFKVSIVDFGRVQFLSKVTANQRKVDMYPICTELIRTYKYSISGENYSWDNVIDQLQKEDFIIVIGQMCRKKYNF